MRFLWVSAALVVLDQLTKQWVRVTMLPGESIPVVGEVLRLTYTTNPGMAFGMTLGSKLFLTLFSIAATVMIGVYLWYVRRGPWGYQLSLALIIGGAVGNVIDRTFYGVLYGYAPLFHGEVIDFIHVDLWRGIVAEWVPIWGGSYLALFPIWNVADMAIVVGVAAIIVFQRRFHEGLLAAEGRRSEEEGGAVAPVTSAAPVPPAAGTVSVETDPVKTDSVEADGHAAEERPSPSADPR
jgi:signal peptidase II